MGAKGLVSRWKNVESTGAGPGSVNPISGAFGIAQWLGKDRKPGIAGNTDFDAQLAYVLRELSSSESTAGALLRSAQTAEEGARAATAFERAENYQRAGHGPHEDDHTEKTLKGIPGINTAAGVANPFAHWDPNFDQALKVFKNAKPLGSDRHSMNQINDYRSVDNDVNIHVTGASSVDLTARSLSRPRNADLIRNTASYAA